MLIRRKHIWSEWKGRNSQQTNTNYKKEPSGNFRTIQTLKTNSVGDSSRIEITGINESEKINK